MAAELYLGGNAADGTPITAVKTVVISTSTGAPVSPATQDAGANRVVLYDSAGNPLIVTDYSADAQAVNRKSALVVSQLMALNPAGTADRVRLNAARDVMVQQRHAAAWQSATAAAATGVTLTIPAAGAGIFNYLVYLQIIQFAAALLTAAATPVLVTTTGMTGTPTFSFGASAQAQGTTQEQKYEGQAPIVGSAANTAMTIVCPGTTSVIWRVNAAYFTA